MKSMNAVLQLQPADTTDNVISLDPARRSRLADAAAIRAAERHPVRAPSLVIALAVGALIGALISLTAVDAESAPTGDRVESEVVAP